MYREVPEFTYARLMEGDSLREACKLTRLFAEYGRDSTLINDVSAIEEEMDSKQK